MDCKSFLANTPGSCNAAFGKEESLLKKESIDSILIGWTDLLHGLGLWFEAKIAAPSKRILAPNMEYNFSGRSIRDQGTLNCRVLLNV